MAENKVGGLASSARPELLHKISLFLKNYVRDATPPLTSTSISIENILTVAFIS
jgi:hypothetical protein